MLGTDYVRLGEDAKAIPVLEKAAATDFYGDVHYQMYVAYRKLGKTQLAGKPWRARKNCGATRRPNTKPWSAGWKGGVGCRMRHEKPSDVIAWRQDRSSTVRVLPVHSETMRI